jgi:hypothetical protein
LLLHPLFLQDTLRSATFCLLKTQQINKTNQNNKQRAAAVARGQKVLGALYDRVYDAIRARGAPPPDETVLWACLARLKDPRTGDGGD